MRRVSFAWYLGSALLLLACGDGNTNGAGCAAGLEACNGACVAIGSCISTACPTGQELCSGNCVVSGTCTTGSVCAVGQIVCNGACYTGTTCLVISTGVGGQSSTTQATGGAGTTTTTTTTTAGTGSTSTGGTTTATTTTPYVDTNPTVCSDTSTFSTTLKGQYDKTLLPTVASGGKTYGLFANWWGLDGRFSGETVVLNGLSFTANNPNGQSSTDGSKPIGFPSLMIGNYSGVANAGSHLPMLVSSISSVPVIFNTNVSSVSGDLNAALDVWFNTNEVALDEAAYNPNAGFLMVWQNYPNGSKVPRGSKVMTSQSITGVSGTWDVWVDTNWIETGTYDQPPCVSYVSTSAQTSLTFDLNAFIKHAVSNGKVVTSSMYLAAVFGGFEIWSGGTGAKVSQFCAKVN